MMIQVNSILFVNLVFILIFSIKSTHQNEWNTKDFFKREHSLSKPYGGGSVGIPYWDFIGSTIVSNKYIRLTADQQSLKGALWNSIPVTTPDWEIQVQFKVHGHGKDLFGDGFAIWYARDRNELGEVFGYKDYFHGLAIFLDTYSNHNGPHNHPHPYISAMVNNGSLHYDHDRDGTHTELAGCEAQFRNKDFDTYVAIRYENYKLTVSTDIENKNAWKECFVVNNLRLPTNYYFGMSAATGDLSDNHDIISVKAYELESPRRQESIDHSQIQPSAESYAPHRDHIDDPAPSSAIWTVFKIIFYIILAAAVIIGAGVGVYLFMQKKKRSSKRLY